MRTGERPSDASASICSVTTIEPSSAAIAAPARPATTTAESIGPSSRTSRERDRAADEVADAVVDRLLGRFERDDHPGEQRSEQDDQESTLRPGNTLVQIVSRDAHAHPAMKRATRPQAASTPPAYSKNPIVPRPTSSRAFIRREFSDFGEDALRGLDALGRDAAFGGKIELHLADLGRAGVRRRADALRPRASKPAK